MKNLILSCVLLASFSLESPAQWIPLNTGGINNYLTDAHFISADTGWVVGRGPAIFKTTDSGISWIDQQTPDNLDVLSVFFLDANNGWVGRYDGGILKTTDGGNTWVLKSSGTNNSITQIKFIDLLNGIATAGLWDNWREGRILKTTDGGETWITEVYIFDYAFLDLDFSDPENGWAVGTNGLYCSTSDGGNTWSPLESISPYWLHDVTFSDKYNGYIAGGTSTSDVVFKTTNGGLTWIIVRETYNNALLAGSFFVDPEVGWVVGLNGTILSTTNGGTTWVREQTNTSSLFHDVFMVDTTGYAVGELGKIYRYGEPSPVILPIHLIAPNGGEIITAGTDYEILWNSMDVTDVKIEFSDNNGQDWITVIDSLPSTGIYTWVVPTVLSDQCRIKITDYSDPDIFDTSDGVFTIESSKMLNILQPNGGEVIPGGQYYEVQWNSEDVEYVKLEYSINNGASWNTITDSTESVGIFEWQAPNVLTIQGRIRISDIYEPLIYDISDEPFRIDFSVGIGPEGQVFEYSLSQNYPNPFNPLSSITFTIPGSEFVTLKVYDLMGTEIAVLVNEELPAGYYTKEFNSTGLSSGTYFYRIQAGGFVETRKMILLK